MKSAAILVPLALVTISLCGPKDIDAVEFDAVVFPSEGVIGGYDFGDSWDDVKAKHNDVFEVRDEAGFEQLRRKVGDNAGVNGYFIGFRLDDAGKIQGFSVSLNGESQNAVLVRKTLDDMIARYDVLLGPGSCYKIGDGPDNSTACDWPEVPGQPRVDLMYYENHDPLRGSIDLTVRAPESE